MLYDFKCKKCGETKQIDISVNELKDLKVICNKCNNEMIRNWKAGITVATNDRSECIEETSWLKNRFKNRPSGKSQIIY